MEIRVLINQVKKDVAVGFSVDGRIVKQCKARDIPEDILDLRFKSFSADVFPTGQLVLRIEMARGLLPEA